MVNSEPQVDPNGRYNSTETSRLLGVGRSTLRRWVQSGQIKYGTRRVGRACPFFTGMEILRVWRARY